MLTKFQSFLVFIRKLEQDSINKEKGIDKFVIFQNFENEKFDFKLKMKSLYGKYEE